VKEQSHKDEMSRALRGDFERLRERGVSTTLAPRAEAAEGPEPEAVAEPEPVPVPVPVPEPEPESASEHDGVAGDRPVQGEPTGEVTTSGPGLFARLTGR
jgi:hypothetical protein